MGILRKLASQTVLYGLSSVLGRLLNWLLTPVFVNVFAPQEFGILQDLYAFTYYPLILITFGLETAFFRWSTDGAQQAQRAYVQSLLQVLMFSVGFGVVFSLLSPVLGPMLGYAGNTQLLLLVVGIIVLDTLAALPLAKLRYEERARWFTVISLGNVLLTIALNLFFLFGLGLQDIYYILLANLIASAVKLVLSLWRNLPRQWKFEPALAAQMRNYGFFIMVAGLAGALSETLDRNLLPRLWPQGNTWQGVAYTGFELNGIYSAVYKLGMFITLATQAFRYAAEPFFFRNVAQKDSRQNLARIFHYYTLVMLLMFVVISTFRSELVSLHIGTVYLIPPEYWVGLSVVPHILLANVFLGAYLNLSIWFKLSKQVRFALLFTGIGAVITLIVNILFIPKYGFLACAWGTVLAYGAMMVACYFVGQKYYPVPYQLRRLGVYLGSALALLAVHELWLWGTPPLFLQTLIKWVLVGTYVLGVLGYERYNPPHWLSDDESTSH